MVLITTTGDQQQTGPIAEVGGQGLFTKEIQRALLDNRIDLAVHSLKDLPTEPTPGLQLAAVPTRAPVADALLSRGGAALDQLPQQARIGTGSTRRRAQLWHRRPDLQMLDIRGNVDTRIRKLHEGEYDAIILAEAGLRRLALDDQITEILSLQWCLPAVGQGALGIESRADDEHTANALLVLNDAIAHACVLAERAMLAALRGGCLAPVAAWARLAESELLLDGVVLSSDGSQRLYAQGRGALADAVSIGTAVATELLAAGAASLIQAAKA